MKSNEKVGEKIASLKWKDKRETWLEFENKSCKFLLTKRIFQSFVGI
jgi:hypothetical protein